MVARNIQKKEINDNENLKLDNKLYLCLLQRFLGFVKSHVVEPFFVNFWKNSAFFFFNFSKIKFSKF